MYILDYDEGGLFKQYSLHVVYLAFWTTPEAIQTVYSCVIFPAWNGCIRNETASSSYSFAVFLGNHKRASKLFL